LGIVVAYRDMEKIILEGNFAMVPSRKLVFGLIYGLVSGLVFALVAWGMNAFLLALAHFAYPWLTFLLGVLPALLVTGLAGYLTIRFEKPVIGAACWLIAGILLAVMGVWLPLWITPEILPRLDPVLKGWLAFSWLNAYTFLTYSTAIVAGVAFLILGLIENVLIDQAYWSAYSGALLMPLLFCALISAVVGGVTDNMINTRFRNSALALDRLVSFALENQNRTVDPAIAREMHMGALGAIKSDLSAQRRMFYFNFTENADQGKILIDFNGHWALCDVFLDQPAFCQPAQPPQ
jgi:hypothetical protein